MSDLREAFDQPSNAAEELPFFPKRTVDLSDAIPNLLAFACNNTRLVVGLVQGDIAVFDTGVLFSPGSDGVVPLHTFLLHTSGAPRLILPNPADTPLIAVIRKHDQNIHAQVVDVLNVETMELLGGWRNGGTPETTASTRMCSLSLKLVSCSLAF